jgi:hypothetical protein
MIRTGREESYYLDKERVGEVEDDNGVSCDP